jgi:hypothetical protein
MTPGTFYKFRHHLLQDVDFPCIISGILSKSVISASRILVLVNILLCVEFCNENMSKMLSRAVDENTKNALLRSVQDRLRARN